MVNNRAVVELKSYSENRQIICQLCEPLLVPVNLEKGINSRDKQAS